MTTKLADAAMLASLKITGWNARKVDRDVTRKTLEDHHASSQAGAFHKRLLADRSMAAVALKTINQIGGEARTLHYYMTAPWLDSGARILPASLYISFADKMRDLKADFEAATKVFFVEYEAGVHTSQQELGDMYDVSDYPALDEIKSKFAFEVAIAPMPVGDDFRVTISDDARASLTQEIEARSKIAMAGAINDAFSRVALVAGTMVERLKAYVPGDGNKKATGTFHASLVENVRDLAKILPDLNIANDPLLAETAERLKSLATFDASELRDHAQARQSTGNEAQAILDQISDYMA